MDGAKGRCALLWSVRFVMSVEKATALNFIGAYYLSSRPLRYWHVPYHSKLHPCLAVTMTARRLIMDPDRKQLIHGITQMASMFYLDHGCKWTGNKVCRDKARENHLGICIRH